MSRADHLLYHKAQKQLQRVNVLARVLNSIIRAAFANGFIQQLNQTA